MSVLYALAYMAALGAAAAAFCWAYRRAEQPAQTANWQRRHHRIPAAPDNTAGVDDDHLAECQAIAAAGTANRRNTRGTR